MDSRWTCGGHKVDIRKTFGGMAEFKTGYLDLAVNKQKVRTK